MINKEEKVDIFIDAQQTVIDFPERGKFYFMEVLNDTDAKVLQSMLWDLNFNAEIHWN